MPERARFVHESGIGRRMMCPECGHLLPPDAYTECDRCGAHLELQIAVVAEGIDT